MEAKDLKNVIKWATPVIQAIISVLLLGLMIISGLLPVKYLGIVSIIVILLLLITILTSRSRSLAARTFGTILAILTCLIFLIGSVYLYQVIRTLNQVSGSNIEISTINVTVADSNPARSIEETSGYTFGVFKGTDGSNIDTTIAEIGAINGDTDIKTEIYDSALHLAQAILDGNVDAGICSQSYAALIEDSIPDYSALTRIIYEKAFEEELFPDPNDPNDNSTSLSTAEQNPVKSFSPQKNISLTEDSYTILISGIDVSGPINTRHRSDVNIMMTVNPKEHHILLSTTPRDFFVTIPGISGESRDKLTHAGLYGVYSSMRTLENLYGIDIHGYIRINFDSLVQLIDELDGVDVHSDFSFDAAGYHFVEGMNHLNGDQALAFSRNRTSFKDGDNQRGKNQMLVLTAILNKLQSPALLKNPSGVLDVVGRSMQTSLSTSQITGLISWQLNQGTGWEISRQAVIGTSDHQETFSIPGIKLFVLWPDESSVNEAADNIREMMNTGY